VSDRARAAFESLVRGVFPDLDFLARYPARVVSQNSDGTLELVPDDQRIPGMSKVPIRYGVPGIKATIAPGGRVLIGFAGGNRDAPEAELWESASVLKFEVNAAEIIVGPGANQPVALATSLRTELNAIWQALALNVHTGVTSGTGVTGSSGVTAATQTIASSKVKVSV
jgi:hypothetical protein